MNNKLRIGVIGGGGIARSAHIANYRKYTEMAEVVAVADVNEQALQLVKEQFAIPNTYADALEMLQQEKLDAVSVCTPNKYHASSAIAALQAGCHVLCEKPPAMNAQEAVEMESAAVKSGKKLFYGFHHRFSPAAQMLRRYSEAGELGSIYAGKIMARRRSGIPGWGVFTNKELQGGGPLIDIGVHMLDLALHLMHYPEPKYVFGMTYRELGNRPMTPTWGGQWDYRNYSIEDLAMAMITFHNGATLQLETSFIVHTKENETMNIELYGSEGGCSYAPPAIYKDMHGTIVDITPGYLSNFSGHQMEIEAFLRACQGESTFLSTASQGVFIQKLIDAIYASARGGKPILLN